MSRANSEKILHIIIVGAAGRMGKTIEELVEKDPSFEIAALVDTHKTIDNNGDNNGDKNGDGNGDKKWRASLDDVTGKVDGVIEFTHAGAPASIAGSCAARGWPLVSGTTALTAEDRTGLERAAEKIPILQASNLSFGIYLIRRCLASIAAESPEGTELEILEIHHGGKRDAPSGTAGALFETWSQSRATTSRADTARAGEAREVYGRSGITGPRSKDEVGIHAIRLGEVVGEHRCYIALPGGERLELAHQVTRRESFARGALYALRRLVGRPHGFYGVDDIF